MKPTSSGFDWLLNADLKKSVHEGLRSIWRKIPIRFPRADHSWK
jgi:hypothetical protein